MAEFSDFGFNPEDQEPDSFEPIPAGEYKLAAVSCELKQCGPNSKDPNGQYLKYEFTVTEGEYKGRKIWKMFNVRNKNETAVKIAKKELTAFCRACGRPQATDSDDLLAIEFIGRVSIRTSKDFDPQNEIRKFKPLSEGSESGEAGAAVNAGGPAPQGDQSSGEEKPPW